MSLAVPFPREFGTAFQALNSVPGCSLRLSNWASSRCRSRSCPRSRSGWPAELLPFSQGFRAFVLAAVLLLGPFSRSGPAQDVAGMHVGGNPGRPSQPGYTSRSGVTASVPQSDHRGLFTLAAGAWGQRRIVCRDDRCPIVVVAGIQDHGDRVPYHSVGR